MRIPIVQSLVLGLLASCSHEVDVAFVCDPPGAVIYEEGVGLVGTCPVMEKLHDWDITVQNDTVVTRPINVIWPSGVSLLVPPRVLPISEDGVAAIAFSRPVDQPYLEEDRKAGRAFQRKVLPPEVKYASFNKDADNFVKLNRAITCIIDNIKMSSDAICP